MLMPLALSGFALAALAHLAFSALLGVRGTPRGPGRLFLVAILLEATWAAAHAAELASLELPPALPAVAEAGRLLGWLFFLRALLQSGDATERSDGARRLARLALAVALPLAATLVALAGLSDAGPAGFVAQLAASIFMLVCLEQVYRNTPAEGRWALKYLAIALLARFVLDLVLYSEALLFARLNPALWTVRGYASVLMLPLLGIAAARNQQWNTRLTVSRDVVFHSATLFGTGLFLTLMALGGYLLRWFGGDWGEAAQALFVFAAGVALLVGLFSGSLRARLRVLLSKHFFRYRYDYRAEWLRLTELLSGGVSGPGSAAAAPDALPLEVRALQGLARLVESPGGILWLAGEDGEYACSARWACHAPAPTLPADDPLVHFLCSTQWVVRLPEWRERPELYAGLRLPPEISNTPEHWLIVPLMLHEQLLGFALLSRPMAPVTVDWEVRDALKVAARQVASYLAVRRAVESLVQARQFDSFNRMSAFVVHDLKNLVAQLTLMMGNAARHRHNPEFQQDMLDTVENVLGRMQGLLMQLRAGTRPIESPSPVMLIDAIEAAIRAKEGLKPAPRLLVAAELRNIAVLAHRERLERVLGHLLQNAAEATPSDGSIQIRIEREHDRARIEVQDTGKGMSESFIREQLFRPFDTTKAHGMGIGAFESREYVRELGGSLEVESREGVGTVFRIRLPLALATAAG